MNLRWKWKAGRVWAALLAVCLLAAAAIPAYAETPEQQRVTERYWRDYADVLGLTPEQRLEDYDYLWKTLEDSFIDLGVAQRGGVDLDAVKRRGRARVQAVDSDFAFPYLINNEVIGPLGRVGHLAVFDPQSRSMVSEVYGTAAGTSPEYAAALAPYLEALGNPVSAESYARLEEPMSALNREWSALSPSSGGEPEGGQAGNVTADFIGSTAYLKIGSMLPDPGQDRAFIFNFYQRARHCDNLIIDITENGGGSIDYWRELIVAPNITEPVSYGAYLIGMDSANNRPYLSMFNEELGLRPIREMPELRNLNRDDRKRADFFGRFDVAIQPSGEAKAFEGKIWVLVGPRVYSASEQFAAFCKQTGFATLVGSRTGGDGFGMDPIYCVLPNSGLIVRYSLFAGLNPDGSNNQEAGTLPDITKKKSETALDACLRAIANGR